MNLLPNCIGFVFHALGITREETFISPKAGMIGVRQHFDEVELGDGADAVMVTYVDPREGLTIDHMAVVDPGDRSAILHRRGEGAGVTRSSRLDLRLSRPIGMFETTYLRKKER